MSLEKAAAKMSEALAEARALIVKHKPGSNATTNSIARLIDVAVSAYVAAGNEVTKRGFTVCLQEDGSTGTTHVSYHEAETSEAAVLLARAECASDWDEDGGDEDDPEVRDRLNEVAASLHVLAVMAGDVAVLEWTDQ